jgi:O-antigen ligase
MVWIGIGLIQMLPIGEGDSSGALQIAPSSSLSLDPFATRMFLVRLVTCLVFFAASLTFVNSSKSKRVISTILVAFGAFMAFYGILQWLTKPDGIYGLRPTPQAIPFASFVNQHHFAALMEMTIGLGLGMLLGSKARLDRLPVLVFALLIMAAAIVLTGSRGGMLSLVAVISTVSVFGWFLRSDEVQSDSSSTLRFRLGIIASVLLGLVVLAGFALFLGGADSLLRGVGLQASEADFTSGRSHFWKIAWQVFLSHPIIGAGFDSFGVSYTQFDTMSGMFRVEQAHNDYIQTLADGGILAFTALTAFIILLFRKGLRGIIETTDRMDRGIAIGALAGCAGILTHSFFDFPLRTPANGFFFLMLATLAVNKVDTQRANRRNHR